MNEIFEIIRVPLLELLALLITVLVGFTIQFIRGKIGVEKMRMITSKYDSFISENALVETLVRNVIMYVQEAHEDLLPEERYDLAYYEVSNWLKKYGIEYAPEEIEALIHSILKDLKSEFREEWYKEIG